MRLTAIRRARARIQRGTRVRQWAFGERERGGLVLHRAALAKHVGEFGEVAFAAKGPTQRQSSGRPGAPPPSAHVHSRRASRRDRGCGAVEALDGREPAADKQRLHHHVVPLRLAELLGGIGIGVRHRLEHGLHWPSACLPLPARRAGRVRDRAAGRARARYARRSRRMRKQRSSRSANARLVAIACEHE